MLGRAAYHEPGLLGRVDAEWFGEGAPVDPFDAVARYRPYLAARLAEGVPLSAMTRHMLGLFNGRPGARAWRRILTTGAMQRRAPGWKCSTRRWSPCWNGLAPPPDRARSVVASVAATAC